jgi:anti-anti-sigma regulatory factor
MTLTSPETTMARVLPMPPSGVVDGWTVVVLPVSLRAGKAARLEHRMLTVMRRGYLRLVLDVGAVEWSDDVFRLVIENTWRRVQLRGGQLRIVADNPAARRGLRNLRLPGQVHVFPSVKSALTAT